MQLSGMASSVFATEQFMKRLLVFLALMSALITYASDWVELTGNSDSSKQWQGLKNSYELRLNKNGDEIVVWTEKEDNKITRKITIQKLYVKTSDCIKKQGKAVVVNMDGDFRYEYDFIFGVETVGSFRAETLCNIYLGQAARAKGKSL